MEEEKIYIPGNVKAESYFFDGFGMAELIKAIISSLAVSAVWVIVYFVFYKSLTFLIISIMITISGSVMIFMKDNTNQSMVDYINNLIVFAKSRKIYIYSGEESLRRWESEFIKATEEADISGCEYNTGIY